MLCPKCQRQIPDGSLTCPACQETLAVQCAQCGHPVPADLPCCPNCGRDNLWGMRRQARAERLKQEQDKARAQGFAPQQPYPPVGFPIGNSTPFQGAPTIPSNGASPFSNGYAPPFPNQGATPFQGASPFPNNGAPPFPNGYAPPFPNQGAAPFQGASPFPNNGAYPFPNGGATPFQGAGLQPAPGFQRGYVQPVQQVWRRPPPPPYIGGGRSGVHKSSLLKESLAYGIGVLILGVLAYVFNDAGYKDVGEALTFIAVIAVIMWGMFIKAYRLSDDD